MLFAGAEMPRRAILIAGCSFRSILGEWPAKTGKEIGVENGNMDMDHMIQKRSPRFEP